MHSTMIHSKSNHLTAYAFNNASLNTFIRLKAIIKSNPVGLRVAITAYAFNNASSNIPFFLKAIIKQSILIKYSCHHQFSVATVKSYHQTINTDMVKTQRD